MTLPASIRRRSLRSLALVLLVGSGLALGRGSVGADPTPSCSEAAIEELNLPVAATVDEVRVEVARHSPRAGAAIVRIDAGRFGRRLHVSGAGPRGLKFSPALRGRRFEVALDPAFEASTSACVERITLLHHGRKVATVLP